MSTEDEKPCITVFPLFFSLQAVYPIVLLDSGKMERPNKLGSTYKTVDWIFLISRFTRTVGSQSNDRPTSFILAGPVNAAPMLSCNPWPAALRRGRAAVLPLPWPSLYVPFPSSPATEVHPAPARALSTSIPPPLATPRLAASSSALTHSHNVPISGSVLPLLSSPMLNHRLIEFLLPVN